MSSPCTGALAALSLLAPSWVFAQIDPLPTVFWFRGERPTVVVVHREVPEGGAVVQKLGLPPEESRLAEFTFDPAYTAVDARPVNDLDGLGKKAIALLASNDAEMRPIIKARSLRGKRLRNIRLSKGHQPVALDILPDQNGNQAEEALVLAQQTAYDRPRLLIRDLATKERIKAISLPKIFEPLDVAVIPDVDGNGFNEALVLAARKSDGRDFLLVWDTGDTGKIVHIKLKPGFTAIDHGYYRSSSRGDLVMALLRKPGNIARHLFFDPLTGELVMDWSSGGKDPVAFTSEYVRTEAHNGTAREWRRATLYWVESINRAKTGGARFGVGLQPIEFTILDHFAGTESHEVAALLRDPTDSVLYLSVRDISNNELLFKVTIP